MNKRLLALGGALCAVAVTVLPTVQAQTPTNPNGAKMRHERHPEIRRALATLQRAQNDLRHAASDFGGHKEKAMDLTQQAINELKQALQADKN